MKLEFYDLLNVTFVGNSSFSVRYEVCGGFMLVEIYKIYETPLFSISGRLLISTFHAPVYNILFILFHFNMFIFIISYVTFPSAIFIFPSS